MAIEIRDQVGRHGREVVLETSEIVATILPEIGFKIASLKSKLTGREFLFQPRGIWQGWPLSKARFIDYDAAGCDEMLPTIDECKYLGGDFAGQELSDHGEVWKRQWDTEIVQKKIIGQVELAELPLSFKKSVWCDSDNSLVMDYELKNVGDNPVDYLWALHPLSNFESNARLLLPKTSHTMWNVHQYGERGQILPIPFQDSCGQVNWDVCELSEYPKDQCYKFYLNGPIKSGTVGVYYRADQMAFLTEFDPHDVPFLGVWINHGDPGVMGDHNLALEPASGFFDSLAVAQKRGTAPTIMPGATDRWRVTWKVLPAHQVDFQQFL